METRKKECYQLILPFSSERQLYFTFFNPEEAIRIEEKRELEKVISETENLPLFDSTNRDYLFLI